MHKISCVVIVVFIMLLLAGCYTNKQTEADAVKDYGFKLRKLPYDSLYHQFIKVSTAYDVSPTDSNRVQVFEWKGTKHYHPVQLAHRSLDLLSDYRLTTDAKYLNRAVKSAETILSKAVRYNKSIYFPYTFDYNVLQKPELALKQPWYSGMAQGMLLSTFCRLYYVTHEKRYKAVADSILNSLAEFGTPYAPVFISEADSLGVGKGYYWIDEYPHPTKIYVLNGSIIGAMGLYDHWRVFGDKKSKRLLSRELTTIKDHVPLYRNVKDLSSYDLKYREKFANYHQIHIELMQNCYDITGDSYFLDMKRQLEADVKKP